MCSIKWIISYFGGNDNGILLNKYQCTENNANSVYFLVMAYLTMLIIVY